MVSPQVRWLAVAALLLGGVSGCAQVAGPKSPSSPLVSAEPGAPASLDLQTQPAKVKSSNGPQATPTAFVDDTGLRVAAQAAPQSPGSAGDNDPNSPFADDQHDDEQATRTNTPEENDVTETGDEADPAVTPDMVDVTDTGD